LKQKANEEKWNSFFTLRSGSGFHARAKRSMVFPELGGPKSNSLELIIEMHCPKQKVWPLH